MNIKYVIFGSIIGAIGLSVFLYAIIIVTAPFMMIVYWSIKTPIEIMMLPETFRMSMAFGLLGGIIGAFYGGFLR